MLSECKDNELLDQIKKESQNIANQLPALETALLKSLLPKDSYDHVCACTIAICYAYLVIIFLGQRCVGSESRSRRR